MKMTPLRILIVEDDPLLAMLLEELLTGMGHACVTATNQTDAVATVAHHRPDLMIVDGRLRQGSGVSTVDEILLSGPLPHIFLSGDARGIKALRPQAAVLAKPFRRTDLVSAMKAAVHHAA